MIPPTLGRSAVGLITTSWAVLYAGILTLGHRFIHNYALKMNDSHPEEEILLIDFHIQ